MKKIIALTLALCMVLALCACGSGAGQTAAETAAPAATEDAAEATPMEMVDLPTSGQNVVQTAVPLIAGEQMGIWEALGLNVTRTHYVSGPPQLEANPSGDWDIGWIGAPAAITGILTYNMKVISLSGYDYSNKAFCRADSALAKALEGPISETLGTAEDWKGLTILVGRGTVCDADMMFMLDKLGLTEDDVNIVNSDIDKGYQAFTSGSADVIFVSGTYTTMLEEDPNYTVCHTMGGMMGSLSGLSAHELGAIAIRAAVERAGIAGEAVQVAALERPSAGIGNLIVSRSVEPCGGIHGPHVRRLHAPARVVSHLRRERPQSLGDQHRGDAHGVKLRVGVHAP